MAAALPPLSTQQRSQFFDEGFLRLPSLFTAAECHAWRQRILDACATPFANWEADDSATNQLQHGYRGFNGGTGTGGVAGSRGRLQAGVRYEPERSGLDPDNPNALLFVQGTNLLGDAWMNMVMDSRVVGVMS